MKWARGVKTGQNAFVYFAPAMLSLWGGANEGGSNDDLD